MSGSAATACLLSVARPLAAGGDSAVCLPAAAESLVLRVATQLPALGSAAPQLWAPRAPRRHALAHKAKLQRLARWERRAAASDARASQATRRQPVSRFRSTQARTVWQMSAIASWASFSSVLLPLGNPRRFPALHPSTPRFRSHSRPKDAGGRGRRAHLELHAAADVKMAHRRATAAARRHVISKTFLR